MLAAASEGTRQFAFLAAMGFSVAAFLIQHNYFRELHLARERLPQELDVDFPLLDGKPQKLAQLEAMPQLEREDWLVAFLARETEAMERFEVLHKGLRRRFSGRLGVLTGVSLSLVALIFATAPPLR